jgi:hypothetical protein
MLLASTLRQLARERVVEAKGLHLGDSLGSLGLRLSLELAHEVVERCAHGVMNRAIMICTLPHTVSLQVITEALAGPLDFLLLTASARVCPLVVAAEQKDQAVPVSVAEDS